jgi:hypothetical protein
MATHLTGSHRSTLAAIFQHPVARNLHWREVRSLLGALAEVVEEPNGNLKATRGGHMLVVHPSRDKDVAEIEQVMEIRHFLQRSGVSTEAGTGAGARAGVAEGEHLLVVIDHREARIYQAELHGSVPQRILPYDPDGSGRYLHYVQDESHGQRKPERKSFYEAIARTLKDAQKILVFGSGTGASSAMEQLLMGLKRRHPDIAERIVGSVVVDEQHLSEDQVLAKAREYYTMLASAQAPPSEGTEGSTAG